MKFNINSNAAVKHTNTLEQLHRSALPNAIRSTLNSAAFDVKQNTMPQSADDEFTLRAPNFFKANSRVEMAKGFDINTMKSVVGFIGNSQAIEDLTAQEYGGRIDGRTFIPMDPARVSGKNSGKVKSTNRISKIKNIVNPNTMASNNPMAQFKMAAKKAGKGGFVMGNRPEKQLWKINSIDGDKIKMTPIFSVDKGRTVTVDETGFMRSASIESANKMEFFYQKEATKQIDRLRK